MMCKVIIAGICLGIYVNSATQSLDTILTKKNNIERSIDKLEQEKRALEDRSYFQLQRCEQKVDAEHSRCSNEKEKCNKNVENLKSKAQLLEQKIVDLEKERNQAYEAVTQTANSSRALHEKIDVLEEQLKREQSLSTQLADEKMKLEMAQVELRSTINELQKRLEGKRLRDSVVKKSLNKIR